jgi:CubicO group peptidase (beta-lactamase class C family)
MSGLRKYLDGVRPAGLLFLILACLATACAPTLPPATPIPTLIPATATPAATATLAVTATPATTATPNTQALADALDAALQGMYQQGNFNGAALVAQNGHVILGKGYGLADAAKKISNTAQTKFRLGDMTQQFTAMAIMLLQQRGKLKVQDKICQYLTDCPSAWQPVTIHHLLTHTSGIPDTVDLHVRGILTSTAPLEKSITDAKALPLTGQPGARATFSNTDYILLGKIIEAASGQTYPAFLQQNIFGPLGMANTDYDANRTDVAVGYAGGQPAAPANIWAPFSAAGLDSTVGDLYLWDQALYTDKLVPQAALNAIFTPYAPNQDFWPSFAYGYGWLIGSDNNRHVFVYPYGTTPGFAASLARYPDDKVTIIVLSNNEDSVYNIASTLAQTLFAR